MKRNSKGWKEAKSYDVGYGKPPVSGQFKKGQSGNAGGRPRQKAQHRLDVLSSYLDEIITVTLDGKKVRMPRFSFLIRMASASAAKSPRDLKQFLSILKEYNLIAPRVTQHLVQVEYVKPPDSFKDKPGPINSNDDPAKKRNLGNVKKGSREWD
jgi:hypothetical protein